VDFGADLAVFFPDFDQFVGDNIELAADGHYARDGGTENGNSGVFTSCDGLEGVGGNPNPKPRVCPYIEVLPSTLTRHGSSSRVTQLITHSEQ